MIAGNDRSWHVPSVPGAARVGPEVGVELSSNERRASTIQQWKADRPSTTRRPASSARKSIREGSSIGLSRDRIGSVLVDWKTAA
jgi:hypothetical protein